MKPLVTLIAIGICALPAVASAPTNATKSKPKPRFVAPNPMPAGPAMQIPPTMPKPLLSSRLLEAVVCPDRALAKLILNSFRRYSHDPIVRMQQLLDNSKDL